MLHKMYETHRNFFRNNIAIDTSETTNIETLHLPACFIFHVHFIENCN